jgi:glutamine amidotransferase
VLVASEPGDDDHGWTEVPQRSVLTATTAGVEVAPLPANPATPQAITHNGQPTERKDPIP